MRTSVSERWIAALLVLICHVAFFGYFVHQGVGTGDPRGLYISYDLLTYFLPRYAWGSSELLSGRLPLWNPFEYGGLPFLATAQPGVLYPPKILIFGLFAPESAYWIFMVLHYAVSAVGFWLFLRNRGIGGFGAFVGTTTWVFAIPTLISNFHPNRIANLVWVPFIFLLVDRVGERKGRYSLALLALAVAVQMVAGYPEFPLDLTLLVTLHAVVSWLVKDWQLPPWRSLPVIGLAFVLGAVIAAAQLGPTVEAAVLSNRSTLADQTVTEPLGKGVFPLPIVPVFYAFALIGMTRRRAASATAASIFCAAMIGGGWLLARHLPGFGMLRFPFAWLFIGVFFNSWAAAVGAEVILHRQVEKVRLQKALPILATALGLGWAAYCAVHWFLGLKTPEPSATGIAVAYNVTNGLSAALGIAAGLALAVTCWLRGRAQLAALAALVLFVLSHQASHPFHFPVAPVRRPNEVGEIAGLVGGRGPVQGRVFSSHDVTYGYMIYDRIPSFLGAEVSFLPARQRQIVETLGYRGGFGGPELEPLRAAGGYVDAMNLQYIATPVVYAHLLHPLGFEQVHVDPVRKLALMENPDRMGPAWVNHAVRRIDSGEAACRYVLSPEFDPRREVVLEGPTVANYPSWTSLPPVPARALRYASPAKSAYDVTLADPGILVVSESAYPGWLVWIDGVPGKWLTANCVQRAVELPPGPHRVRFEYRPPALRPSLALSGIGLAVLAGLFVFNWRRARRERAAQNKSIGTDPSAENSN